jgi:pyridoxal phosphate enzyme (YggS family)
MQIKNNIDDFRRSLPSDCTLVVVSKTQPVSMILDAFNSGQHIFGENKVQELVDKFGALPKEIEWHLIGHLQTNKVKYIASFVHLIQSVDSLKLLREIQKQGTKVNRTINCLLQVHIATEQTKFGFSSDEVTDLITSREIEKFSHVKILGLMGMATFTNDSEVVRIEFRTLRNLFDEIKQMKLPANCQMNELSMGMSGDFSIAVEEGSTMVRIGTAIFGNRN